MMPKAVAQSISQTRVPDSFGVVQPQRLLSLDAYRGFVIMMMIFVNYLGDIPGIPRILLHASASADTFTLADLVFPGFLFMVGVAIPLALWKTAGQPWFSTLKKISIRFLGLLAVGVIDENAGRYDESIALLPKPVYMTLFFLAVIGLWIRSEKKPEAAGNGFARAAAVWRPWIAAALLIILMLIFRGETGHRYSSVYLSHGWWGILGMIGWAYMLCSLVYLFAGGSEAALMGTMAFMLALYMGDTKGCLNWLPLTIRQFVPIGTHLGSTAANVMAGVIVGKLFLPSGAAAEGTPESNQGVGSPMHRRRIGFMFFFATAMILAALLLRPFHGINKIGATESYTLIAAGINLLAFLVFYVVIDVMKMRRWAAFLVPAGANALFAYFLPDMVDNFFELIRLDKVWDAIVWPYLAAGGWAALLNAGVVTLAMLFLTQIGTRVGLRLKS